MAVSPEYPQLVIIKCCKLGLGGHTRSLQFTRNIFIARLNCFCITILQLHKQLQANNSMINIKHSHNTPSQLFISLTEPNIFSQEPLGPVLRQPWPHPSHFPPLRARIRTQWRLCSSWLPMVANVLYPPPTLPAPSRSLTRESSAINQMNLRKTKRWV